MMLRKSCGPVYAVNVWPAKSSVPTSHQVVPSYVLSWYGATLVLSHNCPATSAPADPGPSVGATAPENCEMIDAHAALMSPTMELPESGEPGRMTADCDISVYLVGT